MVQDFTFKNHKISFLFALLPVATVIFQANRFWPLYDSSFIIENSYRISIGEVPYKDFLLLTTPGTYLIQAFIMKVFGSTLYPQIIYCSLISFLIYLLTYRILFFFNNGKWLNLAITLPVSITGGYGIISFPFYDIDCLFLILLSLFLVLYCYKKSFPKVCSILVGICSVIPVFFKQNMGLVYLAMLHLTFIVTIFFKKGELSIKQYLWFFVGSILAIFLIITYISVTSGFSNFVFSTFESAKLRLPGIISFIQYNFNFVLLRRSVFWLLIAVVLKYLKLKNIWLYFICFFLMLSPIYLFPLRNVFYGNTKYYELFPTVWPVTIIVCIITVFYALVKVKDVSIFFILLLFTVVGVVIVTWLPHGYPAYSVDLCPLLSVLYALLFLVLSKSVFRRNPHLLVRLMITNSIILALLIVMFVISNHQYHWLYGYEIKEKIYHSTTPNLRGLSVPGEFVPNLDNLINFVNKEIPVNEPIILIPPEDPLNFALGRTPKFPLFIVDYWMLDIYKPEEILEKIKFCGVEWMVIKTIVQGDFSGGNWDNLGNLIYLLKKEFVLYRVLPGYEIYHKIN
jgi:hypothetical protein